MRGHAGVHGFVLRQQGYAEVQRGLCRGLDEVFTKCMSGCDMMHGVDRL